MLNNKMGGVDFKIGARFPRPYVLVGVWMFEKSGRGLAPPLHKDSLQERW